MVPRRAFQASLERASQGTDEPRPVFDRGARAEDVEIRPRKDDADAVVAKPLRVLAAHVANAAADVSGNAADRPEEGGELGVESAERVPRAADQRESAADDVVKESAASVGLYLGLQEQMSRQRIALHDGSRPDRRRR